MSQVLILTRQPGEYRSLIERAGLPALEKLATARTPAEALTLGDDYDVVFGEPTLIREVISSLPRLRWVQSIWAGVEPLLDAKLRRDYMLTNARGVFGGLMSEYVFAYLLMHERRIFQRFQAQQEGQWDNSITGSLAGKTIGLLGVGSIGTTLAGTANHFGMKVHGYTRSSEACRDVDLYFHASRLSDFASGLDYLVNVLPDTVETRHMVNASLLGRLPAHAVFINVGRGITLDEPALVEALCSNRLAMAVLDVFEQEPLAPEHVFWHTPNLYMTFHTSAPSLPADISRVFINNYRRYVGGKPLLYAVDFERGY